MKGRGADANPPNRFERIALERDESFGEEDPAPQTLLYKDRTRDILSHNDSPDVPFSWSVNPYRGCEHGCIYCYARPTHEYLGLSAGLDFETKLFVKEEAPALLRKAFLAPSWKGEPICLSGVTDAYQPVERRLGLTRRILEVCAEFMNPVMLITKSRLVARDADVLAKLAKEDAAFAVVSITTRGPAALARAAPPAHRFAAVGRWRAGVPAGVSAPVIPGSPTTRARHLGEGRGGGHVRGYTFLRLPTGSGRCSNPGWSASRRAARRRCSPS